MKITMNLDDLTLREIEDFETASGLSIGEIGAGKALPARALRALVWVVQRREDPAYTYEAAGDVKVGDLEFEGPPAGAGIADSAAISRPSRISTGTRRGNSGA